MGDKKYSQHCVEVIAKQGAKVQFAAVDTLGQSTDAYVNRRGYLGKDATINWALGIMNDGNVIADFDSELRGDGSHSQVNVIGISTGRQVQGNRYTCHKLCASFSRDTSRNMVLF